MRPHSLIQTSHIGRHNIWYMAATGGEADRASVPPLPKHLAASCGVHARSCLLCRSPPPACRQISLSSGCQHASCSGLSGQADRKGIFAELRTLAERMVQPIPIKLLDQRRGPRSHSMQVVLVPSLVLVPGPVPPRPIYFAMIYRGNATHDVPHKYQGQRTDGSA